MRSQARLAAVLFLLAPTPCVLAAESPWLPPPVAEGAARQLAERLSSAAPSGPTAEEQVVRARRFVADVSRELETWGTAGVLARAPELPQIALPSAGEPHLDAMGRFQACNLLLFRQFVDPAFADDADARSNAALGLTAVTLAIVYLRQPYLDHGGDVSAIEGYLTGEEISVAFDRIQSQEGLLGELQERCDPLLGRLFAETGERQGDAE